MVPYTSSRLSNDAEIVCRKSWTRYALNLAGLCGLLLVALFLNPISPMASVIVSSAAVVCCVYRHCELSSASLCVDIDGVWESGGLLPWARGVRGVKWDDLDEAAYSMGFWGWLFNSHRVVIRHRYKKGYEIALDAMHAGAEAAARINEMHKSSLRIQAGSGEFATDHGEG